MENEERRSSDILVAELRTEMVAGFGKIDVQLAELKTYLIGIDGKNGLRGGLQALREVVTAHIAGDSSKAMETRQEAGNKKSRALEDKKSRRILIAAIIASLLASPVLTRVVDQVFPEKIHATETAEARGPTIIQGEVK